MYMCKEKDREAGVLCMSMCLCVCNGVLRDWEFEVCSFVV